MFQLKVIQYFLKLAGSDSLEFIAVLKHNLNKLKWSNNEDYLFISTLDLNNETTKSKNPETSELLIYSLVSRFTYHWHLEAQVIKNFFPLNDFLIFDDGFDNKSIINIYDLNQKKVVDVIKPKTGCGLVIFPQL